MKWSGVGTAWAKSRCASRRGDRGRVVEHELLGVFVEPLRPVEAAVG